jgi:hypothetical protein
MQAETSSSLNFFLIGILRVILIKKAAADDSKKRGKEFCHPILLISFPPWG